ncbi:hypothetical protein SAMN05216464_108201 [Mucilaginibacter pineti]|uniref:Uncharacterized protein n=1 Tax=Mucilaginibacter pineti TaxID=1391627 RepID=A0A1G7EXE8_9SPHI|nr:hypothetical protein [Mucilaginibacter pineti]SDE68307.1 hypothetical protein SAMN05216464_108201 [Mucilaginibacter pineti]
MRLTKVMMVCSILAIGLAIASCKKEKYQSRDISMLKPPPPVDTTTPPVIDTSVVIDNCDKADGWQVAGGDPVVVATGQKEGAGYIQGTIKTGQNFMQFIKTLPAPVNTKVTLTTGELKFWFYVPDVSLLKVDGQIQFSSAADPDNKRVGWGMDKIIPTLKNGWNHLELKFTDGYLSGDGGPDLSAMNFVKIFFWTAANAATDQNFGIDDIRVAALPPPPDVVFDNCDKADGWQTVGDVKIITPGQKEGAGFIQNTITNGNDFMQYIKDVPTPVNTTFTESTGRFQFWWYVSDVSLLKQDGSIEITSSGKSDDHESAWDVTPLIPNLKNGWNKITLDFDKSIKTSDGGADYTAINHFRLFFFTADKAHSDLVTGIDDLRFISK